MLLTTWAKSQYKTLVSHDTKVLQKVIKQPRDGELQKRTERSFFVDIYIYKYYLTLSKRQILINNSMNKYETWYNSITANAKNRTVDGYVERHHIIPVSLGGSNNKENLVDLTAREHFICHWLLTKIYTGESRAKMIYALNGMKRNGQYTQRYETKITSRVYENLKKEFSIVHSAKMKGREPWNRGVPASVSQIEKNRKAALQREPQSKESRELQASKTRGQKRTEEQKARMKASMIGIKKGPMSDAEKTKRSVALKGKKKPPGHTEKRIATLAKQLEEGTHYSQQKQKCPHCDVVASKGPYTRYHGDKCRHKP
jgi:5-methylcytosine-specific restriction endonuclease McrA